MAYNRIQKDNGPSPSGMFGKAVSINGYYAIVGSDSNKAFLYKRDTFGSWSYGEISPGGVGSSFGDSVSIYQDVIVIGEPEYNSNTGRIFIINRDDIGTYSTFEGSSSGDFFGNSVSVYQDYVIVGSKGQTSNRGSVYIYEKDADGVWQSSISNPITALVRNNNDYFGYSVGINNNYAIIGAIGNNNKTGCIYVFSRDAETDLWKESQQIIASDGSYNDEFGYSISVDGDYCAVGARLKTSEVGNESNAGAVYIYKYSDLWYEIDKIVGSDESSYENNYFGESVCLNGNYLVVGSSGARATGVSDLFCKKNGWSHFEKISESGLSINDYFGKCVSISGRFVLIGSSGDDTGGSDSGSVYFYENSLPLVRLAQEFEVNGEFVPSKASVYLKRFGKNDGGCWSVYTSSSLTIDATNFSTISGTGNVVLFNDAISGFTGNGYMILMDNSYSEFKVINYPIRAVESGEFYLWIRCLSSLSNSFVADILLDESIITTINEDVSDPSSAEWTWVRTRIILPDSDEHILGIKIKEVGAAIDKIYIDYGTNIPYSEGPDYNISAYLTIHIKVATSNISPDEMLYVYDYKNTITEVICDGWYNFDIRSLDQNHGYTSAGDFSGNYFLILSSSGSNESNFVVWEMVDNDEYMTLPSAIRY